MVKYKVQFVHKDCLNLPMSKMNHKGEIRETKKGRHLTI